jgi:hypothetical protein
MAVFFHCVKRKVEAFPELVAVANRVSRDLPGMLMF